MINKATKAFMGMWLISIVICVAGLAPGTAAHAQELGPIQPRLPREQPEHIGVRRLVDTCYAIMGNAGPVYISTADWQRRARALPEIFGLLAVNAENGDDDRDARSCAALFVAAATNPCDLKRSGGLGNSDIEPKLVQVIVGRDGSSGRFVTIMIGSQSFSWSIEAGPTSLPGGLVGIRPSIDRAADRAARQIQIIRRHIVQARTRELLRFTEVVAVNQAVCLYDGMAGRFECGSPDPGETCPQPVPEGQSVLRQYSR